MSTECKQRDIMIGTHTGFTSSDELRIELKDENTILESLLSLPKWRFDLLSAMVSKTRKIKVKRCRLKRGNLSKEIPELNLLQFFKDVPEKYRYAFLFCLFFGLREGELKYIKYIEELNLLQIDNRKEDRIEYIVVHGKTKELMKHIPEVNKYNKNYLRTIFSKTIKGNICYGKSEDGRNLWLYSVHSFRHTAINLFAEVEPDFSKQISFSRHSPSKMLGRISSYRHIKPESLKEKLELAFDKFYKLI